MGICAGETFKPACCRIFPFGERRAKQRQEKQSWRLEDEEDAYDEEEAMAEQERATQHPGTPKFLTLFLVVPHLFVMLHDANDLPVQGPPLARQLLLMQCFIGQAVSSHLHTRMCDR